MASDETTLNRIQKHFNDHLPDKVQEEVEQEILKTENKILKWLMLLGISSAGTIAGVVATFSIMQYQVNAHDDQLADMPSPALLDAQFREQATKTAHVKEVVDDTKEKVADLSDKMDTLKDDVEGRFDELQVQQSQSTLELMQAIQDIER